MLLDGRCSVLTKKMGGATIVGYLLSVSTWKWQGGVLMAMVPLLSVGAERRRQCRVDASHGCRLASSYLPYFLCSSSTAGCSWWSWLGLLRSAGDELGLVGR